MGQMITNFGTPLASAVQGVTLNISGPFGATQVIAAQATRVGNVVYVEIPALTATGGSAVASATSQAGVVPAGMRPQATIYAPLNILSNSLLLAASGKVEVTAAGNLTIYADLIGTGLWSALGNAGWQRMCLQYIVA